MVGCLFTFRSLWPPFARKTGTITINKTVTGNTGDINREWHFIITLSEELNGIYGEVEFINGVAEIALKHGEMITITDLPVGVKYEVVEIEGNTDDYTTTSINSEGIIEANITIEISFVNDRDMVILPPQTSIDGSANLYISLAFLVFAGIITLVLIKRRVKTVK